MNGRGVAPLPKTPAPKPAIEPPKCNCGGSCDRCASSTLQRSGRGVPQRGGIDAVQNVLRTPGAPLNANVRTPMERAFNHDFSRVRVHHDSTAGDSARLVGARAYTVGDHIAFGAGAYEPSTEAGRRLLAHELAHTIQQRGRALRLDRLAIGASGSPAEREADAAADAAMRGGEIGALSAASPQIARQRMDAGVDAAAPPDAADAGVAPDAAAADAGAGDAGAATAPAQPDPCSPTGPVVERVTAGSRWTRAQPSAPAHGFRRDGTGPFICRIHVQIHPNDFSIVTLTWANSHLAPGVTLPPSFRASAGAGWCNVDCRDANSGNSRHNRCTPLIGRPVRVQGFDRHLSRTPSATAVTWIDFTNEIAFHHLDVPRCSQSHGCVRMEERIAPEEPQPGQPRRRLTAADHGGVVVDGAAWIHDYSIAGVTTVTIERDRSEGRENFCYDENRHERDPVSREVYEERLREAAEQLRRQQERRRHHQQEPHQNTPRHRRRHH